MKLFEPQTNLISYTYPIVKIIISIFIIILLIFGKTPFNLQYSWIKILTKIISFILCCSSIMCIYISVGELFYTYSNRKMITAVEDINPSNLKCFNISEIIVLIDKNDIIEIIIYANQKTMKIGASSDCKYSDSVFFDKKYYIDDAEYDTLDEFKCALLSRLPNDKIWVLFIDGIAP